MMERGLVMNGASMSMRTECVIRVRYGYIKHVRYSLITYET